MTNKINIPLPKELVNDIKKNINGTNFNSVADYIIYILRQAISGIKTETDNENEEVYSKKEEEEIKKNLKEMGYI